MKYNIIILLSAAFAFIGCNKWMDAEPVQVDPYLPNEVAKDDAYYEALRAWKKSEHSVSFGWYSEWGEGSVSTGNMLCALPDSMDIISLWDNSSEDKLTPKKREDLRVAREVKGLRVVVCSFVWKIGDIYHPLGPDATLPEIKEHYGWVDGQVENNKEAMNKWIKDVADYLDRCGYDGIDIDYEPGEYNEEERKRNPDPIMPNRTYITHFVKEMGKYIGPQSGTGKLFILDGYINTFPSECGPYFDYFVSQAYSVSGGAGSTGSSMSASNLNYRLSQVVNNYKDYYTEEEVTNKFICTDNLESASVCLAGGYTWFDSLGRKWDPSVMPTLVGFADWNPSNGFRKGGFGGYRFSNERANTPPYKWMRKAIQQQNPAPGADIVTEEDYK